MHVGLFCPAIFRAHTNRAGVINVLVRARCMAKETSFLRQKRPYFSPQKRPTHANRAGSVNIRVPGAKNEYLVKAHILLNFCFCSLDFVCFFHEQDGSG